MPLTLRPGPSIRAQTEVPLFMSKTGGLALIMSIALVATAANAIPVPELDPGSASMGIALLAGGLLLLNGRRRKR